MMNNPKKWKWNSGLEKKTITHFFVRRGQYKPQLFERWAHIRSFIYESDESQK